MLSHSFPGLDHPLPQRRPGAVPQVLMYSHDTFGLGHLRRCREIAHALVNAWGGVQVMIISGATIAGAFDYRARVDFVKIPSVIKLRGGEYVSMARHLPLEDTLAIRSAMIRHTAQTLRPDIFITDKEPLGLQGELLPTLRLLRNMGTRLVLGLREVMDSPELLQKEWAQRDVLAQIEEFYDRIWVYGPEGFHDPLVGLDASGALRSRMFYTGFLRRSLRSAAQAENKDAPVDDLLVTTGGGGDGAALIRQVFAACRVDPQLAALRTGVVLGPYLPSAERESLMAEAADLPNIAVSAFETRMEERVARARSVVAMGGYNTFCEVLSFDRPALIVPRTHPRQEQLIRARRGAELGLVQMMMPEEAADPLRLAAALRTLPSAPRPSERNKARCNSADLDGLDRIAFEVGGWIGKRPVSEASAPSGDDRLQLDESNT